VCYLCLLWSVVASDAVCCVKFCHCCRILATLRHPNIVAYYESFFDEREEQLFIVQVSCMKAIAEFIIYLYQTK